MASVNLSELIRHVAITNWQLAHSPTALAQHLKDEGHPVEVNLVKQVLKNMRRAETKAQERQALEDRWWQRYERLRQGLAEWDRAYGGMLMDPTNHDSRLLAGYVEWATDEPDEQLMALWCQAIADKYEVELRADEP